jgi:transposase
MRLSRVEVLAGPERRRRWSADQKLEIVQASFEPGVTIAEVARRFDVTRQQIYQWRSDCRAGRLLPLSSEMTAFVPVDVVRAEVPMSGEPDTDGASVDQVEVGLVGGRCLRIPVTIDSSVLQHLIRAIEAA